MASVIATTQPTLLSSLVGTPGSAYAEGVPTLTKSLDGTPDVVDVGQTVRYKLTYSCSSLTVGCGSLIITDTIAPELDYLSAAVPPNASVSYDAATRVVRVTVANFEDGQTANAFIVTRVKPSIGSGTVVSNTGIASVSNPSTPANQIVTTPPVTVTVSNVLTPSWTVRKIKVVPGGTPALDSNVAYYVQLCSTNLVGNVNLSNAVFTDTFPAGAVVVNEGGGTIDHNNNTITWNLGNVNLADLYPAYVASNAVQCVTKVVWLSFPSNTFTLSDTITNMGVATGDYNEVNSGFILTGTASHGFATPPVVPPLTVSFNKRLVSATPNPGTDAYYAIDFVAASTGPITNVVVTDTLPVSYPLKSFTTSNYTAPDVQVLAEYSTDDGTSWTPAGTTGISGANKTYAAPADFPASGVTNLRWTFFNDGDPQLPNEVSANFSTHNGLIVQLSVPTTTPVGSIITNCANAGYIDLPSGDPAEQGPVCSNSGRGTPRAAPVRQNRESQQSQPRR